MRDVHLYQTMSVLCIYLGKEILPNHVCLCLFHWIDNMNPEKKFLSFFEIYVDLILFFFSNFVVSKLLVQDFDFFFIKIV